MKAELDDVEVALKLPASQQRPRDRRRHKRDVGQ